MPDSFSERLAKKIELAKAAARGEQPKALVPVRQTETRMADAVKAKAAEIAQAISLDASAVRGLNAIQAKVDNTNLGSPMGAVAFFKRLGTEARTKYNEAQSREISTFTNLQTSQHTALKQQITSSYQLSQLPHDLAMETFLKEAMQQAALTHAVGSEQVLRQAFSEGWGDIVSYTEVKKTKALEEVRLSGRQIEIQQDVQRARELQQIDYDFTKKKIDDEVDGTIQLASTEELVRQRKVKILLSL